MRQPATTHVSTLRDYLQVARRRKWIIALAVVIVPLAALAFSLNQQAQYRGSAQVLLSSGPDISNQLTGLQSSNSGSADRQAQTQASLARVPAVAQGAIRAAHAQMSPLDFLSSSSVTAGANSDILTFDFTHSDPTLARVLATAYARSYVRYRLAYDTAPINSALHEVESEIEKLPTHGALYTTLEDKAIQLRTLAALKTANASVVRSADGVAQTAPQTRQNVIVGLMLGLFLGLGLAFLREAVDTRVRSADTIAARLELPLLARLPGPPKKLRGSARLAMLAEPSGPQAEAFRMLRTNVEFASLGKEGKVIMVTSATEQEGKSTTVANLAVAMARAGKHVVLVDLDLRRPYIDRFFDLGNRPGLTQVALGVAQLVEAIVRVPLGASDSLVSINGNRNGDRRGAPGALDVLPAGAIPPDPGEFVGTQRLTEILEHLRAHSDVVLIDAPPLLRVGDGLTLSSKVDSVLVVTRMEVMRRPMLNELARLLATMPARKLGFIVTGAEAEENYSDGYVGSYYHRPYELRERERSAS